MNRSFAELKKAARETLNMRYTTPVLGLLTSIILTSLLIMPFRYLLDDSLFQTIIYYLADFVIQLLSILFSAGLLYLHMNMRRKKSYSLKDIFYFVSNHPDRFILAYLLLIGILLLTFIPLALFSIPAILMKSTFSYILIGIGAVITICLAIIFRLHYNFVFFLMIDHPNMKIKESFATSRSLMKGKKMYCFLLQLSFFGWFILGVCSLSFGFLWISPYYQQTMLGFYEDTTIDFVSVGEDKLHEQTPPTFEAFC